MQDWYLMNTSGQLSGYEKEEFQENYSVFSEILSQSPETYDVVHNGVTKQVIIQSDTDDNKRRLLSKINDFQIGDILEINSTKWIITSIPFSNNVYDKTEITLCNYTIEITVPSTKTQIGTTDWGEPVYEEIDNPPLYFNCVVEAKVLDYSTDQKINLPDGELVVYMKYEESANIVEGKTITIYGKEYHIRGLDLTKTMLDSDSNRYGLLRLILETPSSPS